MEILQLKYFKKIAEVQNLTKVSHELHVSQPALSKVIKNLENELGVKLFDRKGRYIDLNDNGHIFLKHVNICLNALSDAKKELHDFNTTTQCNITLYVQASMYLLPKLIQSFNDCYPNIHFLINQKQFSQTQIKSDFRIYAPNPEDPLQDNEVTIIDEELIILCNKTHWLSAHTHINLSELKNETFISLPKYTTLRHITDQLCATENFKANIILESSDSPTILELVRNGMGIALVPQLTWGKFQQSDYHTVRITNPKCRRKINLLWQKNVDKSNATQLFKEHVIQFYKNLAT
ncbi:LysR family transcriptional regulator [Fusibacter ferrireducens]|uniref:LysR family transcriptional regulator n=1 Tax=Fusibacter ferrireducens TaxID=2785058 RepID=A0ABR9ZV18_9FIRM|nr:LysR family transcriptional regulator [Fusibacter ferrireducens]MBF4694280.1 LysR family transcriptional regulator [Fusibacter ferrireducens]